MEKTLQCHRKHLGALLRLPFLPSRLLCSAQHKHKLSLFVARALAAWNFSSCLSTGQRKKWIANRQCWKWPELYWLEIFVPALCAAAHFFFFSNKPLARRSTKKAVPVEYRPSRLQGVADAMKDSKLFLCAQSLPGSPLYSKHWCVHFHSTLVDNKRADWHMAVKLFTAGHCCGWPPITKSPYPGERRTNYIHVVPPTAWSLPCKKKKRNCGIDFQRGLLVSCGVQQL